MNEKIEKCICGKDHSHEHDLIDALYPMNRERTKWNFSCTYHNGGCGRTVYADTKEGVVKSWNNGENHETII